MDDSKLLWVQYSKLRPSQRWKTSHRHIYKHLESGTACSAAHHFLSLRLSFTPQHWEGNDVTCRAVDGSDGRLL